METPEIKTKVKNEFDKHDKNKSKEEIRHEEALASIREEAGIEEVKEIRDELKEKVKEGSKLRDGMVERIRETIFHLSDTKSISVPKDGKSGSSYLRNSKKFTVRDESVYYYRKGYEASLDRILKDKEAFKDITDDKEKQEILEEILELASKFKESRVNKKKRLSSGDKLLVKAKMDVSSVNIESTKGTYSNTRLKLEVKGGYSNDINQNLETVLDHREDIKELLEQTKEEIDRKVEKWEEAKEKIKKKGSKYLVMEKL